MASDCRYTDKSYLTLKELHKEFGPYHFNVLAFPCNQFGESEPRSSTEVESFARRNYGVTFPIFHKIKILGPEAEPAFRFLVGKYLPLSRCFSFLFSSYIIHTCDRKKIYRQIRTIVSISFKIFYWENFIKPHSCNFLEVIHA